VERLNHYFSTYKDVLGEESSILIETVFDVDHALKVVDASLKDYIEA